MNMKKFMILMTLSPILIASAIAQVSSENSHVITGGNEVPTPGAQAELVERVAKPEFPPGHNNATASAGQNEDQESVEVEVVMATSDGFEPAVVTRPHGPFVLAVHNRSGARELVLRLASSQDGQGFEARLRPGRRRHHQTLNLPPGEYILSEASHPAWRCQILLTR